MKKEIRSFLALCLICAILLGGCGSGTPDEPETTGKQDVTDVQTEPTHKETLAETQQATKPVEEDPTEPPTEPPTEAPTEAPTQAVIEDPFAEFRVSDVNIPLLAECGNAVYMDMEQLDDYTVVLRYAGASKADVDLFLWLCSYLGIYRIETEADGNPAYYLLKPGTDYIGYVSYVSESKEMYFQTDIEVYGIEDELMAAVEEYYLQDLTFPADFGMNVCPQFYVSANAKPFYQGMIGELDYVFDGAMCWMEMYSDLAYTDLEQYASDMLLCGFDVWFDYVNFDDSGNVSTSLLHFSNGDLEIIVQYDSGDGGATVYYEPGVMMYLLGGTEYAAYIPQR